MTEIIFGLMGIAILYGAFAAVKSVFAVMKEQFEELMPQRMVDLAGFVEVPHHN